MVSETQIFESSELVLYSKLFEPFSLSNFEELQQHLDLVKKKIDNKNFKYYFLISKVNNNEILDYGFNDLTKTEHITNLELLLKKKIKNIDDNFNKEVVIKLAIIETVSRFQHAKSLFKDSEKNNLLYFKLHNEFCNLKKLFYEKNDKKSFFENLSDRFFSFIPQILLLVISFFTISIINLLNSNGILISYLSLENLTVIINIFLNKFLAGMLYLLALLPVYYILFLVIEKIFDKYGCDSFSNIFAFFTKVMINISVIIFVAMLLAFSLFPMVEPFNIRSKNFILDYIKQVREPTVRKIRFDNNQTHNILLLAKDNKFIYYLNKKQVEDIMDNDFTNCTKKNSYIDNLYYFLSKEVNGTNVITNRRHLITKIDKVNFIPETPSFYESFCKK